MKFGSLFAGIGGFDLGLERAGMTCAWQVEIDDFCQKVLAKHWPDVPKYRDIREVGDNLEPVDLICGGFPCQPWSEAGNKKGKSDDRDLWYQLCRVVKEIQPRWVIGENVRRFAKVALDNACSDLEGLGYTVRPFLIPACAVGAGHERNRLFMVAYASSVRLPGSLKQLQFEFAESETEPGTWNGRRVDKPGIQRVVDGVPNRVDRLRSLGNAVVPQVVEVIGKAIMEVSL